MVGTPRDYREMADPTEIRWNGQWYLYGSCGGVWDSDGMVNWAHHPLSMGTHRGRPRR